MAGQPDVDEFSGTETTGHEWDGIKELNNPLPRWWLYTFYICIIWSIGYWIVMPAWPLVNSYTKGFIGHSDRANVARSIEEARAAQGVFASRMEETALEEISADPELLSFALAGGRSAFAVNCSQCHGLGAAGSPGYPNLNDDDWIWGGTVEAIHQTILYGIRSEHDESRQNEMPAYLADEILTRDQVDDVVEYVLSLTNSAEDDAAVSRGAEIFAEQCVVCHEEGGVGNHELGAPNLADQIWLYGGDRADLVETVSYSRRGVMPPWIDRLDSATIKKLAVYVHSLGGGE
ncbi:MAG: cytochrome-c oxidase, cbb3-type subunit III [Minwuiales bacterium]|nr:cytochrome-c oxidase, cbb3-type subunit III [Minwuiales bacterium]